MLTTEFGTPLYWEIAKLLVMFRSGKIVACGSDADFQVRKMRTEFMTAAALSTESELDVYLDGFDQEKKQSYDDGETRRDVSRFLAVEGIR